MFAFAGIGLSNPVEERGGEFVAAEFAVLVGVALLEGTGCTASAGSVLDVVQVMPSVPEVSA